MSGAVRERPGDLPAAAPPQIILVRLPVKGPKKAPVGKSKRSPRKRGWRSRQKMKTFLALVLGFLVYVALGRLFGFFNTTLFTIPLLGSFGAFSFKGVIATVAAGWVMTATK